MGIQRTGAFGGFVNKTGPLVGRFLKGQNVITAIPAKSSVPATRTQLDQRQRFGLMAGHLSYLDSLISRGFKKGAKQSSPMNRAVSYNVRFALTGTSPLFAINHAKLAFSRGKCPLPADVALESIAGAKVDFSWGSSNLTRYGGEGDRVNLMVYSETRDKFVILENAGIRSELGFTLQLPVEFTGSTVHCYLSFTSVDGKVVSNTAYAGQMVVI